VTQVRLDRVFTFGNQLSFLIPHEWVEEEEADHYLYHAPNADSGWLRVSLLTLRSPGKGSREQLRTILAERSRKSRGDLYESRDNIIVAWEEMSEEDGVPICNYWWAVGHSHGLDMGHEALFSYTVVRKYRDDSKTHETVALLAKLVADARFAQPKVV
jgi:hypothetical protein